MRKVNVATLLFFSMPLASLASNRTKSLAARLFSKARDNKVSLNFNVLEMIGHIPSNSLEQRLLFRNNCISICLSSFDSSDALVIQSAGEY